MPNYNKPVEEDEAEDVMTVEDFRENVESGGFIDYDGWGYPVRDGKADYSITVQPSRVNQIPDDATHILWLNR